MAEKIIRIEGMRCMHCAARVKKALEAIEGVETADVSYENGTAEVRLATEVKGEALRSAVEALKFRVTEITEK